MMNILTWLHTHKFEAHTIAFIMMIVPPIPLYFAAQRGFTTLIWVLMIPFILGNLLVLVLK